MKKNIFAGEVTNIYKCVVVLASNFISSVTFITALVANDLDNQ